MDRKMPTRWHKKMPLAGMPWTRLRKIIEAFFADSVRKRVTIHITQYRTCGDRCGRGWITVDGKELISAGTHAAWAAYSKEAHKRLSEKGLAHIDNRLGYDVNASLLSEYVLDERHFDPGKGEVAEVSEAARQDLIARGIFTEGDFCDALRWYADAPIEEILASANPIVRAIAMLDRRVGKRRLKTFEAQKEHMLVRRLLEFRLQAEGLAASQSPHRENA